MDLLEIDMSKVCSKCQTPKPLSDYHKKSESKDGLSSRCKSCRNTDGKLKYSLNKDKESLRKRKYRQENPDRQREVQKKSRDKRKTAALKATHEWDKMKKATDPVYKFKKNIHSQLNSAFSGRIMYKSKSQMNSIIGLSSQDLVNYLWSTFELNYGIPRDWVSRDLVNIDHIVPKCKAKTIEDVKKLNHYTNLQLLLKEDNMKKWKY